MTHCTNCGAHIVNICFIDGLPYGQDCASKILGISIPSYFRGDAREYKAKKQLDRSVVMSERGYLLDDIRKNWNDWVRIMVVYNECHKSGSFASQWECSFIDSIRTQLGMPVFEKISDCNPELYLSNCYDPSHVRFYDLDFLPAIKPVSNLSTKQLAIFEKIESKIIINA